MPTKTKEVSEISQYIFKSRVKGIDGGYKLSELLSGKGSSADAFVNAAVVEFKVWGRGID